MESLESQIAEWRRFVEQSPAVDGRDAEELEAHLRDQVADLSAAGLAADEAFLVAVKRMGSVHDLSREFAREHSGRLWKQLVLSGGEEEVEEGAGRWPEVLLFAVAAAMAVQVARIISGFPDQGSLWFVRNASLLVLPFLAGWFARQRRLTFRQWLLTAGAFVVAGMDWQTERLVVKASSIKARPESVMPSLIALRSSTSGVRWMSPCRSSRSSLPVIPDCEVRSCWATSRGVRSAGSTRRSRASTSKSPLRRNP